MMDDREFAKDLAFARGAHALVKAYQFVIDNRPQDASKEDVDRLLVACQATLDSLERLLGHDKLYGKSN